MLEIAIAIVLAVSILAAALVYINRHRHTWRATSVAKGAYPYYTSVISKCVGCGELKDETIKARLTDEVRKELLGIDRLDSYMLD